MDSKNDQGEKRPASVLQGDGFYFNRILSRDSSVGQSSRIYYRRAEGVPFKWEMQPGTPRNLPEEEVIPPLSPPPLVQSKGLPKPCVDQPKRPNQSKVWFWKKIKIIHQVRKVQISSGRLSAGPGSKVQERFHLGNSDGEFIASSNNSCSSSFSTSHSLESSSARRESLDGPFCCSPSNMAIVLDDGNRKVNYCRDHKTAFALENDGSFLSKILSRVSSVDESFRVYHRSVEGVPFKWEMQPGTPKHPQKDEFIPPPSPPPAVQSLGLSLPKPYSDQDNIRASTRSKIWLWIKSKKVQQSKRVEEMSFRVESKKDFCCSDLESMGSFGDSISRSSSTSTNSISKSNSHLRLSKLRRDLFGAHFCFNPWNI